MGNEFSDKTKGNHKITLVKGNTIISNDDEVAKEFDNVFTNAVKKLDIPEIPINNVEDVYDAVDTAILKYKDHPSILKIMEKMPITSNEFEFQPVTESYILKEIKGLESGKATLFKHIPVKILKENADLLHKKMTDLINTNLEKNLFSDTLKLAGCSQKGCEN